MSKRILTVTAVILIMLLVYGGLRLAEKGISDIIFPEQSGRVLSWQRDVSGEFSITLAGKTVVINVAEIYTRFLNMWDKLIFTRR